MKLSSQEEYGIRCLISIAVLGEGGSRTIPDVAKIEGITEPHAAKLLTMLRKSGFLTSTRGQTGGYRLAKPANKIIIGEVMAALGGRLYEDGFCDRFAETDQVCRHIGDCALSDLWSHVQFVVDQVVFHVTLQDLLDRKLNTEPMAFAGRVVENPLRVGS